MKKKKQIMPTVAELKSKAPELDIYKITPNARYLILYKKPRILTINERAIQEQVDSITMALSALKVIAVGVIIDASESLTIVEMK